MARRKGAFGETKLKILAIMCSNENCNEHSYGYSLWEKLRKSFHCYLEEHCLRNVYHHLEDLQKAGYIKKNGRIRVSDAPPRNTYMLTDDGRALRRKYEKYLKLL